MKTYLESVRVGLAQAEAVEGGMPQVLEILFPLLKDGYLSLQRLGVTGTGEVQETFDYLDRLGENRSWAFPFLSKILRDLSCYAKGEARGEILELVARVDGIEYALTGRARDG